MSVNDKVKKDIYETYCNKQYLKSVILNGNEIEKEFSLRVFYQLSFDDNIAEDLMLEKELMKFIYELTKNDDIKRKGLKKVVVESCGC